jgi:hypothetical protein
MVWIIFREPEWPTLILVRPWGLTRWGGPALQATSRECARALVPSGAEVIERLRVSAVLRSVA